MDVSLRQLIVRPVKLYELRPDDSLTYNDPS